MVVYDDPFYFSFIDIAGSLDCEITQEMQKVLKKIKEIDSGEV